MDIGHIIFGVISAMLGVFTLSFAVFWAIIKNVENRLCQKITEFGDNMKNCQSVRSDVSKSNEEKFAVLFTEIAKKANLESADQIYVRKREHELEFSLLKEKMDSMQVTIKELKVMLESKK